MELYGAAIHRMHWTDTKLRDSSTAQRRTSERGLFAQVGDVLAYRLVELTASWTPELSTYKVKSPCQSGICLQSLCTST